MIQAISYSFLEPLTCPGTLTLPLEGVSREGSTSLYPNMKPDTVFSKNSARKHPTPSTMTNSETSDNAPKGKSSTIQLFRIGYQHTRKGRSLLALAHQPKGQKIPKDKE